MPEATLRDNPREEPQPQIARRTIPQNISVRAKPRPPSSLNTGRLAALIDRSVDDQRAQDSARQQTEEEEQNRIEEAASNAQLSAIEARLATATLESAIRQMVEACWNVPTGAKDAQDLLVRLRIQLRPDGSLARPPEFLDRGRMSDPFYRAAAESAARAVRQCAPFNLPPDQYELWRDLTFNFDPKESKLDQYNLNELQTIFAENNNISIFSPADESEFTSMLKKQYEGTPYWKIALILSLFFLLTEILLIRFL